MFGACKKKIVEEEKPVQLPSNIITPIFVKTYSLSDSYFFTDAIQTNDNAYAICGMVSANYYKPCIIRTNSDGDTLWSRIITSDSTDFVGLSIVQTSDNGFILLCSHNQTTSKNINLIKFDENGNTLWRKNYYHGVSFNSQNKIIKNSDNTYTICGNERTTSSSVYMYLLTINENGDSLWAKEYNNNNSEICNTAILCNDNGFALLGENTVWDDEYMVFRKTDNNGNTEFLKQFTKRWDNYGWSLTQDNSDNFYLLGMMHESVNQYASVLKTDAQGNELWYNEFYIDEAYNYPRNIFITSDNNLFITHVRNNSNSYMDKTALIKMNKEGTIISTKYIENLSGEKSFEDENGDIILIGGSFKIFIAKIDYTASAGASL